MPVRKNKGALSEDKKSSQAFAKIRTLESEISEVIRELERTLRQFDGLSRFSSLVASSVDAETLIQGAEEAACQLVQSESSFVFLNDPKSHSLIEKPIVGPQPRSILRVPVQIGQSSLGVIQVLNKITSISAGGRTDSASQFNPADQRLLEELAKQLAVGLENFRLRVKVQKNFAEMVEVLGEAIEKKDRYTGGHTKRVAYYAVLIAKYLGLTSEQSELVRLAAILHDVGKIGIEDQILKKNAALNDSEWLVMKTHPELGYEILSRMEGENDVIDGAHFHHERWDGKGYPKGLKGEEIPLIARIVSLADAYDALVSNRPYREGVEPKLAYEEILKNRGTQFDPRVVDAFVEAFRLEKMGKGSGGSRDIR